VISAIVEVPAVNPWGQAVAIVVAGRRAKVVVVVGALVVEEVAAGAAVGVAVVGADNSAASARVFPDSQHLILIPASKEHRMMTKSTDICHKIWPPPHLPVAPIFCQPSYACDGGRPARSRR
jgi:hypothetical protein